MYRGFRRLITVHSKLIIVRLASSFWLLSSQFFFLPAGWLLFALQCSLLAVQCLLLASHTLFLAARSYLFDVCSPLPVVRFSHLISYLSLLLARCWIYFHIACYSPFAGFGFRFAVRCSSLKARCHYSLLTTYGSYAVLVACFIGVAGKHLG